MPGVGAITPVDRGGGGGASVVIAGRRRDGTAVYIDYATSALHRPLPNTRMTRRGTTSGDDGGVQRREDEVHARDG